MQKTAVEEHAETLRKDGVIAIEDYVDGDMCDAIRERVREAIEDGIREIDPSERDYLDMVTADEPEMIRRSGEYDDGMLDIYNVDLLSDDAERLKNDEFILSIIEAAGGQEYIPLHINAYVNESVKNTRDYHADTYGGLYKTFVYLTDVPDESYGPYSYIRGTNDASFVKKKLTKYVNKYRGDHQNDAVFYEDEDIEVFTASKGTLLISDQSGYHRGIPQEEGRERVLVNTQYQPASEYEAKL